MKVLLITDQYIDIRPDGCYCNFALLGTLKNIRIIGELYIVASQLSAKKVAAQPLNQKIEFIDADRIRHFKPLTSSIKEYFLNNSYNKSILKEIIPQMDLVIGYAPGHNLYQAIKIAKNNHIPFMTFLVACPWDSMHNHQRFIVRLLAPIYYLKTKLLVKRSDYVHYVTKEFLQRRYPTNGKALGCSDVNLGKYNLDAFSTRLKRISTKTQSDIVKILTTAHLDIRFKGQEYVIKAIAKLIKDGEYKYHYYMIGAGEGVYLRKLATKLQVENNIHFLGRKTPDEVMNLLIDADIYIQPSLQEGLPRAVVEAMSVALPCIGFNTGGIPELLNSEFIVRQKDTDGIVQCIRTLNNIEHYKIAALQNFNKAKEYKHSLLTSIIQDFFKQIKISLSN